MRGFSHNIDGQILLGNLMKEDSPEELTERGRPIAARMLGKPTACYTSWQDGQLERNLPIRWRIGKLWQFPGAPEISQDLSTVLRTGTV